MKKLLPISMLAMVTVCPAFADIDNESMCVVGTLNESSNNGNAGVQAIWTGAQYSEDPGYYLLYNSQTDTLTPNSQCPAGSWCPGFTNQTFADATIGINTCPNGYTNSAQGSSANTDCYRTCTNNDIPHSTGTVNGGMYYNGTNGDGVNACVPTNCVTGYHVKAAVVVPNLTTYNINGYAYRDKNGSYNEEWSSNGAAAMGLESGSNKWSVQYADNVMLFGEARCSTVEGDDYSTTWTPAVTHTISELGAEGGEYCYCNLTGYTPVGSTLQSLSYPWVFFTVYGDAGTCANYCASDCAANMAGQYSSRLYECGVWVRCRLASELCTKYNQSDMVQCG